MEGCAGELTVLAVVAVAVVVAVVALPTRLAVTVTKVGEALVATFCIEAINGHLLLPIVVDCIEFKFGKVVIADCVADETVLAVVAVVAVEAVVAVDALPLRFAFTVTKVGEAPDESC